MFGDFVTLSMDQIINGLSKISDMYGYRVPLSCVIRTPMGGRRGYGPTHSQSLEYLFLGVPNLQLIAPSIFHNPGFLLKKNLKSSSPTIFVENKILYSKTLLRDGDFGFQKKYHCQTDSVHLSYDLKNKGDYLIISYGGMASIALEASQKLFLDFEFVVDLLVIGDLKIELTNLKSFFDFKRYRKIVIAEEGVSGIWSAIIFSKLQDLLHTSCLVKMVFAKASSIPSAPKLEAKNLPGVEDIVKVFT